MIKTVRPGPVNGDINPPPDKSISHRALLFSGLASGDSIIRNLLDSEDTAATRRCLSLLGVSFEERPGGLLVRGSGMNLVKPTQSLYCSNSGTTMRLLAGVLAGQSFSTALVGDPSLNRRPMERVLSPLRLMGATAHCSPEGKPPVIIKGGPLEGIDYTLPVASAQLKSAILLAAIYARGKTCVREPVRSRDHTERMLRYYGVNVERELDQITLFGPVSLTAKDMYIPGDFSSAAPFIVGATLAEGSQVTISGVGLNPTRTGLLGILQRMGADISIELEKQTAAGEPVGNLVVKHASLIATEVEADEVPLLIDEIPLLTLAASLAKGVTRIRGLAELRLKESDRLESIARPLLKMGAKISIQADELIVNGVESLGGGAVQSAKDHRIAMTLAIAGLVARSPVSVEGAEWVGISYLGFWRDLHRLQEAHKCGS